MAENQPEVTQDEPVGEPEGESKPELMGYKSVEDLVAAKVASDQEAKRIVEERNALEAEVAELRNRREQPPAAHANGSDDRGKAYWDNVRKWADKGDELAQVMLMEREERERMAYAMESTYELLDIDDREERRAVADHLRKNSNRGIDIRAARSEVAKSKLEQENARLRAELEASRKKPEKAATDVIRTAGREITADKMGTQTMTASEFDRQVAELEAAGNIKGARELRTRLNNDTIKLRFGQ